MTTARAISAAVKYFEKHAKHADIRSVVLQEGSGNGKGKWSSLTIKIKYTVDGDYTESNKHPFFIIVSEVYGKAIATPLWLRYGGVIND